MFRVNARIEGHVSIGVILEASKTKSYCSRWHNYAYCVYKGDNFNPLPSTVYMCHVRGRFHEIPSSTSSVFAIISF